MTDELNMRTTFKKRIVALLAVRNEALYLERCLRHLYEQGIETCIIDNESTDSTLEIAKRYLRRGVFRIETMPYRGFSELAPRLSLAEKLSRVIDADWFIHHDADEIREAPAPFGSLSGGILEADREGYNAINFDEFVFLPTSDTETFEGTDFVKSMRYYYFFSPTPLRRVNAWKNEGQRVDLVSSGGHCVEFAGKIIYPINFILRHYIVLSRAHAINKYAGDNRYSREEVEQRGWHRARVNLKAEQILLPLPEELHEMKEGCWEKSVPRNHHLFFHAPNPIQVHC